MTGTGRSRIRLAPNEIILFNRVTSQGLLHRAADGQRRRSVRKLAEYKDRDNWKTRFNEASPVSGEQKTCNPNIWVHLPALGWNFGLRLSLSLRIHPMVAVSKGEFRIQKFRTLLPGRSPLSPSLLPRQQLPARQLHLHRR
jgi:hypothetical protein